MRRRIVRTALTVITVALLTFAVPLAVGIRVWFFADARASLERAALATVAQVGPQFAGGDPVEVPSLPDAPTVGVYDLAGHRQAGAGPTVAADPLTRSAMNGSVAGGDVGDQILVALPVTSSETVIGVVRATAPVGDVWRRVAMAWLGEAVLATAALLLAWGVARRQARLLSAPLEALSVTSQRIAEGDLTARAEASAIPEIDRVAAAHNEMVERLTTLLDRSRTFTADASHQLRTPLTALLLGIDNALAPDHVGDVARLRLALTHSRRQVLDLQSRVEDVLALSRTGAGVAWSPGLVQPVDRVVDDLDRRWHGPFAERGRRVNVRMAPGSRAFPVPASLVSQILDVLADNALRHGKGALTVSTREVGDALAVDVCDEGGFDVGQPDPLVQAVVAASSARIGLSLARQLAELGRGRLVLARRVPTTFTLLMPSAEVPAEGHDRGRPPLSL